MSADSMRTMLVSYDARHRYRVVLDGSTIASSTSWDGASAYVVLAIGQAMATPKDRTLAALLDELELDCTVVDSSPGVL